MLIRITKDSQCPTMVGLVLDAAVNEESTTALAFIKGIGFREFCRSNGDKFARVNSGANQEVDEIIEWLEGNLYYGFTGVRLKQLIRSIKDKEYKGKK